MFHLKIIYEELSWYYFVILLSFEHLVQVILNIFVLQFNIVHCSELTLPDYHRLFDWLCIEFYGFIAVSLPTVLALCRTSD